MTRSDPQDSRDPRDPYDLDRFVTAQDAGGLYARALGELRAGRKTGHWMWFIFPQLAGLGASAMSRTYSIRSLAEASAYLKHPVLGARLAECTKVLIELPEPDRSAEHIFGPVDALKLRSCMTLFGRAADAGGIAFIRILDVYFEGQPDPLTEQALATGQGGILATECPP